MIWPLIFWDLSWVSFCGVLRTAVPAPMAAEVAADVPVRGLSLQVAGWLPQAGFAPPVLRKRAAFRMSMSGGGIAGAAYLLRLSLSPTDEDWQKGAEDGRWWLWDALLRPLRLIRKVWTAPLRPRSGCTGVGNQVWYVIPSEVRNLS